MNDLTPTRSAALELEDERRAMREGYRFLDEKRLLLATEMLRQLRRYEAALTAFSEHAQSAAEALQAAVGRHGLDGVQVYPAVPLKDVELTIARRQLLGVKLLEAELRGESGGAPPAEHPSPEAERCRALFADLLRRSAALAALAGNLERLRLEYRRTERRARALEEVLMPEVDRALYEIESRLEEIEQEEAVRVRRTGR
jgi:V/A-type H+-transporting ATPase subunit D